MRSPGNSSILSSLAAGLLAAATLSAHAQAAPQFADGTAIPIVLTHTLDSSKAHVGQPVEGKTMQAVVDANGQRLAKGAVIVGHVTEAAHYREGGLNNDGHRDAVLSIRFDGLRTGGQIAPLNLTVRAVASSYAAHDAQYAFDTQATDTPYTRDLVGGEQVQPGSRYIVNPAGVKVAVEDKDGIRGRLAAVGSQCAASEKLQALGIFSTTACGAYGFDRVALDSSSAAARLTSAQHDIALFSGSAMLLQVNGNRPQTASLR